MNEYEGVLKRYQEKVVEIKSAVRGIERSTEKNDRSIKDIESSLEGIDNLIIELSIYKSTEQDIIDLKQVKDEQVELLKELKVQNETLYEQKSQFIEYENSFINTIEGVNRKYEEIKTEKYFLRDAYHSISMEILTNSD